MIVNSNYEFIFVHIPKVAGTSITESLIQLEGNEKKWVARTKHETLFDFHQNINTRISLSDIQLNKNPKNYYSFAFIRNPWDRMSSLYKYLVEKRPRPEIDSVSNFKDFLIQSQDKIKWITSLHSMKPQLDYFTLSNREMDINFLGHYEHLEEDIDLISKKINCPISLGISNQSSNTVSDYRTLYDRQMVEIVALLFSEEISLFGYTFETGYPTKRCSGELNKLR